MGNAAVPNWEGKIDAKRLRTGIPHTIEKLQSCCLINVEGVIGWIPDLAIFIIQGKQTATQRRYTYNNKTTIGLSCFSVIIQCSSCAIAEKLTQLLGSFNTQFLCCESSREMNNLVCLWQVKMDLEPL